MIKQLIAIALATISFMAVACSEPSSSELPNTCMEDCLNNGSSEAFCSRGCDGKD